MRAREWRAILEFMPQLPAQNALWARLTMLWVAVRDSLWFIPAACALGAAFVGGLLVHLEQVHGHAWMNGEHWLFSGAEGARAVLSTIATGLITVTGVVFSVTIVALQLSSTQFTPRVLRNFTADRGNQVVLGVFIGTFTYALVVLRVVRSDTEQGQEFVPHLAVWLATLLVLVSIGAFIYFIHHASQSMRVSVMLDRITRQTLAQIEKLLPEAMVDLDEPDAQTRFPDGDGAAICARQAGYLQAVDAPALLRMGAARRVLVRLERAIGEFVLPGQTLAIVSPAKEVDEEIARTVRQALVLGPERTPEQDIEYGLIEISDIAIKALSAGINDPTTAQRCIDRLGHILSALGTRAHSMGVRADEARSHVYARNLSFERAVGLAFDQVRHFGCPNPSIARKLLGTLATLVHLLPNHRHAPLLAQAEAVREQARAACNASCELEALERVWTDFSSHRNQHDVRHL